MTQNKDKEIDIFSAIRFVHKFILKYKVILLIVFILTQSLFIYKFLNTEDRHHYSLSYTSNSLEYDMVSRIIAPIEIGVLSLMNDSLSNWLDISTDCANSIHHFELKEILITPRQNVSSAFTIHLYGKSAIWGEDLGKKFLSFFEDNDFVKAQNALRMSKLEQYSKTLNSQISRLDSVQIMIPEILKQKGVLSSNTDLNLGFIYNELANLKKQEVEVMESMEIAQEFILISSIKNIQKTSLVKNLFLGFLLFVFFGIIILVIHGIRLAINQPES